MFRPSPLLVTLSALAHALAPLGSTRPLHRGAVRLRGAAEASGGTRLNKLLNLSRRAADAAISEGRVTVDGEVADGRTPVSAGSEVRLDGSVQKWEPKEAAKRRPSASADFLYLKYWKPVGVTCTSDDKDRSNIIARGGFDALPQRVFTVGRLDKDSTGLVQGHTRRRGLTPPPRERERDARPTVTYRRSARRDARDPRLEI